MSGESENNSGPPPLDYRSGYDERRPYSPVLLISGITLAAGTVLASVFLAVILAVTMGHALPGILVLSLAAAMLIGLAVYAHRKPVRKPLALGIWIGLGIGLLIEGICFFGRLF
jgi:hypothetical protein